MVSNETLQAVLNRFMEIPENQSCVDCSKPEIHWASTSHGVFLCGDCASIHRGLGTKISFLRSLTLDEWSLPQLKAVEMGGNAAFLTFLQGYPFPNKSISHVYPSRAAQYYRDSINARSNELPFDQAPPAPEVGIRSLDDDEVEEEEKGVVEKYRRITRAYTTKVSSRIQEFRQKPRVQSVERTATVWYAKAKEGTIFAYDKAKEGTLSAYEKAKEWSQSEQAQKLKDGTVDAFRYAANKTKEAIQKIGEHPKVVELNQKISEKLGRGNASNPN